MKRLASFFLLTALFSSFAYFGHAQSVAAAGIGGYLKDSSSPYKQLNDKVSSGDGSQLLIIIAAIINIILGFVGLVLVIFLIYGGFLWMTDGGDETQVKNAKHILKNATVGAIIVILAFSISNFVISTLSDRVLNNACVGTSC